MCNTASQYSNDMLYQKSVSHLYLVGITEDTLKPDVRNFALTERVKSSKQTEWINTKPDKQKLQITNYQVSSVYHKMENNRAASNENFRCAGSDVLVL